jgi:cation diffusion facilitator CzcD-associated flavoprotein CzcO
MTAVAPAHTIDRPGDEPLAEVDVAIVGSGFSGLGMAIRLKREGFEHFVVLERGEDVGGTWHYNTYPGCACDVPSHLYSFSFAPHPGWSQTYSPQPEIRDYLRRCADEFGIRPYLRLRHEVTSAAWNEGARRWDIETSRGPFRARVLVVGMGPLTEPKIPAVPGLDRFGGATFHSARWDHDYDLRGKRVASVGTGASAIQYVPAIQPQVERLHVFQRTPPWVFPHTNRRITRLERRLYRALPAAQRLVRGGIYAGRETFVLGFVKNPRLMRAAEALARSHMRRQISDAELLEKVTPGYTVGCKRILPSNSWYPALGQPNVELVTEGIEEVRESSIVSRDGVERQVDAIIFGTGFQVTDMPAARQIRGRDGRLLAEAWRGSPRAHLGTTTAGFPNLFLLLGPNTGLGHSSIVYMIESQVAYVMDALRAMDERGVETVEVRPQAEAEYNERLEARMQGTVWNTGCASWYLDDTGRNVTLWPDWTWRFRQRTARFETADYLLRAKATGRKAVAALS